MGFGYGTRTAYDVQSDSGGRFDFLKVAKRYEEVKPIAGKKRGHLNVRPLGERSRSHERIVKVSDNEYYVTYNAYRWSECNDSRPHSRAITYCLNDGIETITVHTPTRVWNRENPNTLYPRDFSSNSVFYFYDFNLPSGLSMANCNSCKYVKLGDQYYTIEKGDISFTRKQGTNTWMPLVVHREVVHTLDRELTKVWRAKTKPLLDYLKIMVDMVEPKYYGRWENLFQKTEKDNGIKIKDVFKQVDGNAPEHWFTFAEHYKYRIQKTSYDYFRIPEGGYRSETTTVYHKKKLSRFIHQDLYSIVKPVKEVEVPLGQVCKDRYKSWFA